MNMKVSKDCYFLFRGNLLPYIKRKPGKTMAYRCINTENMYKYDRGQYLFYLVQQFVLSTGHSYLHKYNLTSDKQLNFI